MSNDGNLPGSEVVVEASSAAALTPLNKRIQNVVFPDIDIQVRAAFCAFSVLC